MVNKTESKDWIITGLFFASSIAAIASFAIENYGLFFYYTGLSFFAATVRG